MSPSRAARLRWVRSQSRTRCVPTAQRLQCTDQLCTVQLNTRACCCSRLGTTHLVGCGGRLAATDWWWGRGPATDVAKGNGCPDSVSQRAGRARAGRGGLSVPATLSLPCLLPAADQGAAPSADHRRLTARAVLCCVARREEGRQAAMSAELSAVYTEVEWQGGQVTWPWR